MCRTVALERLFCCDRLKDCMKQYNLSANSRATYCSHFKNLLKMGRYILLNRRLEKVDFEKFHKFDVITEELLAQADIAVSSLIISKMVKDNI